MDDYIMLPFKKKKGEITIPHDGKFGFEIVTAWRKDKNEVAIMTEKGPIVLDGKNELYIKLTADSADSIKIQIIPDFKNKVLNFVEVLDPNAKISKDNKAKIAFGGIRLVRQSEISIADQLKSIDKDIDELGKRIKRYKITRDVTIVVNILSMIANTYGFMIKNDTDIWKWVNLFFVFVGIGIIYYIHNSYKKFHKKYLEFLEYKEKLFGVVKEQ